MKDKYANLPHETYTLVCDAPGKHQEFELDAASQQFAEKALRAIAAQAGWDPQHCRMK